MELKTIQIDKVLANFSQPREQFEKEKIQELAESILSNGLINPISVREYKGGRYMIVAGERRWRACKIAGLKTIQAFVKEYKDDIDWQVESLIENWQRVDLSSVEKENNVYDLWKTNKFKTYTELAKKLGVNEVTIADVIQAKEIRNKTKAALTITTRTITDTKGLDDKEKKKIFDKVEKGELASQKVREVVRAIKNSTPEVKKALLEDKISIEQAENLSKIHSPKAREEALRETKQHQHIANIIPKLKENSKPELSDELKKKFMSSQRIIFEHLFSALKGIIVAEKDLKKANEMLTQLMSKQFEYGLNKKDLAVSLSQMKRISDQLNQFGITEARFDELKEDFIERIENKIEE